MDEKQIEIRKKLKKKLDTARYEHTLGVAYTAACLAMRYGADIQKAEVAGLLHDCAKCIPDEEKLQKCEKHHLPISDAERKNPSLLHAKLGAYYARQKYGITDEEILGAITWHTTGRPEMTLLEEIVFIADYIEPDRDRAPNLEEIRTLAFTDLKTAVGAVLAGTLAYVGKRQDALDETTVAAYEYYKGIGELV
ncbi:MAG: bis(5'-nucleosyl)-tetraphosphatase (symmetrical) YqeK [Lachnospiraceae bacterium]|nr:bis(5'-nucleosyl)-tetraphosphatase (symmetrical) YqeK [Lachnospiraceae bacterium]